MFASDFYQLPQNASVVDVLRRQVDANLFARQNIATATIGILSQINILFVRHAESCANMLKTVGRLREKNNYLDTDITARGVRMAEERGHEIQSRFLKSGAMGPTSSPLLLCASALLRTQQTADGLRKGISDGLSGPTINILPYINETGIGKDNAIMTKAERGRLDATKAVENTYWRFFENASNAAVPNPMRFLDWLQTNRDILFAGMTARIRRLVIVTHANWLNELTAYLFGKQGRFYGATGGERYDNLDAAGISVYYMTDGTYKIRWLFQNDDGTPIKVFKYMPSDNVGGPCPDGCRAATICRPGYSSSEGLCRRLQNMYTRAIGLEPIPWNEIRDLAADLTIEGIYKQKRIEELMAGGGISSQNIAPIKNVQKVIAEGAVILQKYAPVIGFAQSRSRREMVADLFPIMEAFGCAPTGNATCSALDELLEISEENVDTIPNWQITKAANSIPNKKARNTIRAYLKPTGWLARKKTRRGALRENLTRIRTEICGEPTPRTPSFGEFPNNMEENNYVNNNLRMNIHPMFSYRKRSMPSINSNNNSGYYISNNGESRRRKRRM